ncbi:MAG: J domain-containing protein [Alphaproteobacteria bacterium]
MNPKRWQHIHEKFKPHEAEKRMCDKFGCENAGEFPAPKSTSNLRTYHYFCLEHVQEYNKSWNFYKGMNADQIEANRRDDVTWQRKTWPFTGGANTKGNQKNQNRTYTFDDLGDPFNLFEGHARADANIHDTVEARSNRIYRRQLTPEVNAALDLFQLELPVYEEQARAKYKELAKMYHPDANGGDVAKEEIFKQLNAAYEELKKVLPLIHNF